MRDAGIDVGIADADAAMLPAYDFTIPDDDVIEVGDLRLRTIHTPGHTRGSTCFLLEGHPVLFSGDTLFPGGRRQHEVRGRRASRTIIQSIDRRLFTLPGDTLVLPGHGLDTTIVTERPHLDEWVEPRLVAPDWSSVPVRALDDRTLASCVTRAVASGPTCSRGCTCRRFPW